MAPSFGTEREPIEIRIIKNHTSRVDLIKYEREAKDWLQKNLPEPFNGSDKYTKAIDSGYREEVAKAIESLIE